MRAKKPVVIIITIIAALVLAGVTFALLTADQEPKEADTIEEVQIEDGEDDEPGLDDAISTSTDTIVTDDDYNSAYIVSDMQDTIDGWDSSYPYAQRDEMILGSIDQNRARDVALNFARCFLTYDTASLRANAYRGSWISDVIYNEANSALLRAHMTDEWTANTATYDGVVSRVTDIAVDSLYVSHETHGDTVAVALTVILDENQGMPGEMDWEYVNTNRVHYAVYLNKDLKVIDIRRQDAVTLLTNITNLGGSGLIQ